jgi:hypothetical protein
MTTSTTGDPRTARLRRAGWWVKAPRVVLAGVLWLVLIEVVPGVAAWALLAVLVAGTAAAVVAEPLVVQLMWWARRPVTALVVPGDSRVTVLTTGRRSGGIGLAGRRHLIVPTAWVGRADLPALLVEARLRQLVSVGRLESAYLWFTWPWQVLASFASGVARGLAWLPLAGFAWRVRLVVVGIAVWQSVVAGRHAAAITLLVVVGLSYLLPWTRTNHERLVRQAVADLRQANTPVRTPSPAGSPPVPAAGARSVRRCSRARRSHRRCGHVASGHAAGLLWR